MKTIEHFFRVYIASSKHSGVGRILEFPNPPRVQVRPCKHGKSALLLKSSKNIEAEICEILRIFEE